MSRLKKLPKEYIILGLVVFLIAVVGLNDIRKGKPAANTTIPAPSTVSQNNLIEKEEGNISVGVQYLPDKSNGNIMFFDIALNNHAVSLDSFDFPKSVVLEKDGNSSYPVTVTAKGEGHHRKADVSFKSVKVPFSIVLLNLGDIPRREFLFTSL